ncbi:unnamed protein product [Mytilus coruscus]|uniref:Uncharacterized protein n=1 Tax=Mytilus coruscus TaxID=42192 RepID=A0A6J8EEP7_MYTCO|nr:unnamed protein product [Mytilus coruscus]
MEFTPGAFLVFIDSLDNHLGSSPNLKLFYTNKVDDTGEMVVERSISVALASRPSEQLYRINMYHTTCRLEINGRHAEQFIQELKTIGEQPNQNLQNLNEIIKCKCQEYLLQKNPAASIIRTNNILVNDSSTSVYNNGANNQCPKCRKTCLSKCILCNTGNHLVNFSCDKLKKEEITLLENKPEDSPYTSTTQLLNTAKPVNTIVTADNSNPLVTASSLKDIQAPKQIELSNREMRQKEIRLKKKEDGIKISKKEAEDCNKVNARLKSYSLKLEAQVEELENSYRILRMKVTGNDLESQVSNGYEPKDY